MEMTLGPFEAVIFDLDGTLIFSHEAMARAYGVWCQEFGIEPEALRDFPGVPSATIAASLLPPEVAPKAAIRIMELEVADTTGVVAAPGAANALNSIPQSRTAIATSCERPLLEARLTASGLRRPDVIVTRDDVTAGKPAPDSYLLAAEQLGAAPANCLVVEDSPVGIQAAQAAGCAVVAVSSTQPAEKLTGDLVIPTLDALSWQATDSGITITQVS